MPIVIKELLASDPLSGAVEKINFNFDQLILAGGGPPGPQGLQGIAGPVGPQGLRGDHWFTGASAFQQNFDHDGISPLLVQDHFLDVNGDIYDYFDDGLGLTGWTNTGINLIGPQGGTGATGSSYEWDIFPGRIGNALSGSAFGPKTPSILVDTVNRNFIAPIGPEKNSLLLGDPTWFYNYLTNWNTKADGIGSSSPYQENIPKLTIIQRTVNTNGLNGISIGARGLTGATDNNGANLITNPALSNDVVNSDDFLNLGFGVSSNFTQENDGAAIWSHTGILQSLQRDILIQAGDTSYREANLRLKSDTLAYEDFNNDKFLLSESFGTKSVFSIGTKNTLTYTNSYINLQGLPGTQAYSSGYGSVIIGSPDVSAISLGTVGGGGAGLIINRRISTSNTDDSSIYFINSAQASDKNDFNAKFVGVSTAPNTGYLALSTSGFAIVNKKTTLNSDDKAWFPFHVNLDDKVLDVLGWSTQKPINNNFAGWIAGFDAIEGVKADKRGIGIGYVSNSLSTMRAPLIQGYYTGKNSLQSGSGNASYSLNDPDDFNTSWPISSLSPVSNGIRTTPHIYLQLGDESNTGNVGIGFGPTGSGITETAPWSKLTVAGSMSVGPTAWYNSVLPPYASNLTFKDNDGFKYGANIFGRIIRGLGNPNTPITGFGTDELTNSGLVLNAQISSIGILSGGITMSDQFLARKKYLGPLSIPSFSLPDSKTGMNMSSGGSGTGELVVPNESGNDPTITPAAIFSSNGDLISTDYDYAGNVDLVTIKDKIGFKVKGSFSKEVDIFNSQDLMNLGEARYGYCKGIGLFTHYSWRYILHEIPTKKSVVFLDLADPVTSTFGFTNSVYLSSSTTINSSAVFGTALGVPNWLGNGTASAATSNITAITSNALWNTEWNTEQDGYRWNVTRRFTLAPGKYSGQTLSLIIGDVGGTVGGAVALGGSNVFFIDGDEPLPTAEFSTAKSFNPRLILSKETDFAIFSTILDGTPQGTKFPYPLSGANLYGFPDPPVSGPQANNSIFNTDNWSGAYQGSGNNVDDGFFVTLPWRVLNLIWVPRGVNQSYCWVETGREYLANDSGPKYEIPIS